LRRRSPFPPASPYLPLPSRLRNLESNHLFDFRVGFDLPPVIFFRRPCCPNVELLKQRNALMRSMILGTCRLTDLDRRVSIAPEEIPCEYCRESSAETREGSAPTAEARSCLRRFRLTGVSGPAHTSQRENSEGWRPGLARLFLVLLMGRQPGISHHRCPGSCAVPDDGPVPQAFSSDTGAALNA
jgi:hypothetical protein